MTYQLQIIENEKFLHAKVSGENSVLNKVRYLKEIRKISLEKKSDLILIEEYLTGASIDPFGVFDVVVSQSRFAAKTYKRIAFVDTNPEHDSERVKFAETLAGSHGVNVRVFAAVHEAAEWLVTEQG